ncbi:sugar kinase [Microbispora sp. NPDC046933]|uniref:sugar kinase n=1 Tax=Microbispora sp. NPDC046933 TaxID=3155618 RepID=UPI0033DB297A
MNAPSPGTVVTIGECMACLTTAEAGPVHASQRFRLSVGGSESNVAIGLSRLGHVVTWISRLGNDELGSLVLSALAANGVTAIAERDDTAPTGLMLKIRRTSEISRVLYYRANSAASRLGPDDVPFEAISTARLLHVTGITPALGPGPAAAVTAAVEHARSHGVTVSFDVNYRAGLWTPEAAGTALLSLVTMSDIVFASQHEAELFTAAPLEDLPRAISELGPSEVVIKLGKRGALALAEGSLVRQPAYPAKEVDPVGAGDAFVAGYLSEWLRGSPPDVRLDTAARTGALAVMVDGDWEGLPSRSELTLLDAPDAVLR